MHQSDRIGYLLKRYLDNACTRQEMDELLDYVEQHPEDEQLMGVLQETWNEEKSDADIDSGASDWSELQKGMKGLSAEERITSGRFWWRIAASILLMAACLGALFFWQENKNAGLSEHQHRLKNDVSTSFDEHRLIVLSDGSRIWLKSNSKITQAPAFNITTREVMLDGEAFFDICHDPVRPFIINTGKVKTTVLGTAFNIRAFPGENAVTVTVTRGKVRVEGENKKGGTITANQQITLNLRSEKVEEKIVDAAAVSRWIKGDLILHNITFGEVEEILEERYSVEIRFANALLKKCRFTSTFFQQASVDEVLTAICLVNGAKYEIHDKLVMIYGDGCDDDTSKQ